MGYFEIASKIFGDIEDAERDTGIELSQKQRHLLMSIIMSKVFVPFIPEQDVRHMIESVPRPDVEDPRPLRRFNSRERKARRAQSDAMREIILDHLEQDSLRLTPYTTNGQHYSRNDQRMFRMVPKNPTREQLKYIFERNEEVSKLFDSNEENRAKYETERVRELTTVGLRQPDGTMRVLTEEEAKESIRRRRSELVLERVAEASTILPQLDHLFSPDATRKELEDNYWMVAEATFVYGEIRNWLSNENLGLDGQGRPTGNGRMSFTPEEVEWLRRQEQKQSEFSVIIDKFRIIANPAYEYLDVDALPDYDDNKYNNTSGMNPNAYGYIVEQNHGFVPETEEAISKTFAPLINDDPTDQLSNFLKRNPLNLLEKNDYVALLFEDNEFGIVGSRRQLALDRLKKVKSDYCLDGEEQNYYIETEEDGITDMRMEAQGDDYGFGAPVAYEKNGRVVILSVDPKSTVIDPSASDHPETLFNYKLEKKLNALIKRLGDADPWYWSGSPQFTAIRNALKQGKGQLKLEKGADLAPAYQGLENLFTAIETYLSGKSRDGQGKNEYEQERIDAAKALYIFINVKRKQLDLIKQARVTAKRFENMSGEQIHEICQTEDRVIMHREHPHQWIDAEYKGYLEYNRIQENVHGRPIPAVITRKLEDKLVDLNLLEMNHAYYPRGVANQKPVIETIAQTTGAMIAAEMVFKERSERRSPDAGPIELLFQGENGMRLIQKLGKDAMGVLTGTNYQYMTAVEMKQYLEILDPKTTAETLTPLLTRQTGLEFLDQVAQQYPKKQEQEAENPIERFNRESIQGAAKRYQEQMASGKTGAEEDAVRTFLSNCIISDMARLEKLGGNHAPGRLEQLLDDPKKTEELRKLVENSQQFQDLMKDEVIRGRKEITINTVPELVKGNRLKVVANQVLASNFGAKLGHEEKKQAEAKDLQGLKNQQEPKDHQEPKDQLEKKQGEKNPQIVK